ncbi:protein-L-isoaspartate O-methyltransferase [Streptomyces sp. NPDC018029]|uniref:protein-L-isoaspartate O-methyltransferase n=1 Tax=Streptomyces sp. NPDC018029 TaxID=3365032 RepID=UPI0037AD8C46
MGRDAWRKLVVEVAADVGLSAHWQAVLESVPREDYVLQEVFVPEAGDERRYRAVHRETAPEEWLSLVCSGEPVITQLRPSLFDGAPAPSSSSSAPATVARMLALLNPAPGERVLDLGSGTGWTAALLSAAGAHVVTVESDLELATRAQALLGGRRPPVTAVCADAVSGHAAEAPYDALHAGFAVRDRIPVAWIDQVRDGGRIVVPFGSLFANTGLARLTVQDGVAEGHFAGAVSFMWERSQLPRWPDPTRACAARSASAVDPREVLATGASRWAVGLQVPGVTYDPVPARGDRLLRLWGIDGSWASVAVDDWQAPQAVTQHGPRRVWDEVCAAWQWWEERGRPGRNRFGITTRRTGSCRIWVDDPASPLPRHDLSVDAVDEPLS